MNHQKQPFCPRCSSLDFESKAYEKQNHYIYSFECKSCYTYQKIKVDKFPKKSWIARMLERIRK